MGLLTVGQLVSSRMGRDCGRKYVVIRIYDENHVDVVDGRVRDINRPKRKNVRHLVAHSAIMDTDGLSNGGIREFIEIHSAEEI